ncbi:MAG: TetR/AcrR family transcriptional regulator [Deltaproteobacteria bacterium]|nr:TetR/AcrR family transcriptional regulator [Deltaproteobacteria bacterium]
MRKHALHGETVTVVRRFSRAQSEKRAAARRAAAELAAEGGYPLVTMAAVAGRIGITRATIYRYFSSKDHLLREVMEEWAAEVNEDLRRRPPRAAALSERVGAAFERIVNAAVRNRGLTSALLLAATSPDSGGALPAWSSPVGDYLETVIGEKKLPRMQEITDVLSYVLFAALIGAVLRGQDPAEATAVLRTAVRLLLPRR